MTRTRPVATDMTQTHDLTMERKFAAPDMLTPGEHDPGSAG